MTDNFDEALADYLTARACLNNLPDNADQQAERMASDAYDDAYDRACSAPASTVAQLRAKAEIMWGDEASTPSAHKRMMFLQDLQRLTGQAPSLVLDPKAWLAWFESRGGGWVERKGEIVLLCPENGRADYPIYELDAHGGRGQVFALIRQQSRQLA